MSEPHGACEKGGWRHFLVSKSRVGVSGFYPVFVFASTAETEEQPQPVDKLFKNFRQISREKNELEILHGSTFTFKIPSQQSSVIQAIKQYHLNTYITLYREADEQYASNMVRFDYHDIHSNIDDVDEDCKYCQIKKNEPLREVRKENSRKRLCRRRNDSSLTATSGKALNIKTRIKTIHVDRLTASLSTSLLTRPNEFGSMTARKGNINP